MIKGNGYDITFVKKTYDQGKELDYYWFDVKEGVSIDSYAVVYFARVDKFLFIMDDEGQMANIDSMLETVLIGSVTDVMRGLLSVKLVEISIDRNSDKPTYFNIDLDSGNCKCLTGYHCVSSDRDSGVYIGDSMCPESFQWYVDVCCMDESEIRNVFADVIPFIKKWMEMSEYGSRDLRSSIFDKFGISNMQKDYQFECDNFSNQKQWVKVTFDCNVDGVVKSGTSKLNMKGGDISKKEVEDTLQQFFSEFDNIGVITVRSVMIRSSRDQDAIDCSSINGQSYSGNVSSIDNKDPSDV